MLRHVMKVVEDSKKKRDDVSVSTIYCGVRKSLIDKKLMVRHGNRYSKKYFTSGKQRFGEENNHIENRSKEANK